MAEFQPFTGESGRTLARDPFIVDYKGDLGYFQQGGTGGSAREDYQDDAWRRANKVADFIGSSDFIVTVEGGGITEKVTEAITPETIGVPIAIPVPITDPENVVSGGDGVLGDGVENVLGAVSSALDFFSDIATLKPVRDVLSEMFSGISDVGTGGPAGLAEDNIPNFEGNRLDTLIAFINKPGKKRR